MDQSLPATTVRVGVLSTRSQPGADNLNDEVAPQTAFTLEEMLEELFETDAHFTVYTPRDTNTEEWPRLNKPVLPKLRAAGADLDMHLLVIDYDNPSHAAWKSADEPQAFRRQLAAASERFPLAADWAVSYTTSHGMRLIYVLDRPLTAEEYERKHQWFCREFVRAGIQVDLRVSDWTRCFRCPLVMRDGLPTWEQEWFEMNTRLGPDCPVILCSSLSEASRTVASEYSDILPINEPQPDEAKAYRLLLTLDGNMTEWNRKAKSRLRGRACFDSVFNDEIMAIEGGRNDTLHRYVGQAVSLLYSIKDTTPDHVYSLFLGAVQRLSPDQDTPDWTRVLWDHVCRLWSKEDAKHRKAVEIKELTEQQAVSIGEQLAVGFTEWCEDKAFIAMTDVGQMRAYVERRMIAQQGRTYYVMNEHGYYDSMALLSEQLIPYIRSRPIAALIETYEVGNEGEVRDLAKQDIINKHAIPVKSVEGHPQIKGGHITTDGRLIVRTYRRNPNLPATYDAHVDEWLRQFFGPKYDMAAKWIAYSLAFEEGPICALSAKAGAGIGKKMLAVGLSECLEYPVLAGPEDLVGDYQYGLLHSPFLLVDEGWPSRGSRHPADRFRELTGGTATQAAQKYLSPVRVYNPARVIFTANNLDVVAMLTGNKDLSPEDREALHIRLLHFNLKDDAAVWLRSRGGIRFTKGWIAGDGGTPSDYTVAMHFLWLYSQRAALGPPGSRFLVEGDLSDDSLIMLMQTKSGNNPLVIEIIVKLLNTGMNREGIAIYDGKIFVLSAEILEFARDSLREKSLNIRSISNILCGLVEVEHDSPFELPNKKIGRRRWNQIDLDILYRVVQEEGWRCPKLEELMAKRIEASLETK